MKTNFIMAQDKTFKNGGNGFMVNIQGEALEEDRKMYFHDALKAMRYCFILKRQTGFDINEEALVLLSNAYKSAKAELPAQEEPTAEVETPAVEAEQVEPEVAPAKPKRGRPKGSKNKKKTEKAA